MISVGNRQILHLRMLSIIHPPKESINSNNTLFRKYSSQVPTNIQLVLINVSCVSVVVYLWLSIVVDYIDYLSTIHISVWIWVNKINLINEKEKFIKLHPVYFFYIKEIRCKQNINHINFFIAIILDNGRVARRATSIEWVTTIVAIYYRSIRKLD